MESKPEIRNIEEKETKVYLVDFIYDNINQSDRLVDRLESGTDIKLSEGIIDGKIEEKVKSSIIPSTMGADKTAKYSNIIEYFEMVSGNIKGKIMIDEEIQALDNSKGNMIDEEIQAMDISISQSYKVPSIEDDEAKIMLGVYQHVVDAIEILKEHGHLDDDLSKDSEYGEIVSLIKKEELDKAEELIRKSFLEMSESNSEYLDTSPKSENVQMNFNTQISESLTENVPLSESRSEENVLSSIENESNRAPIYNIEEEKIGRLTNVIKDTISLIDSFREDGLEPEENQIDKLFREIVPSLERKDFKSVESSVRSSKALLENFANSGFLGTTPKSENSGFLGTTPNLENSEYLDTTPNLKNVQMNINRQDSSIISNSPEASNDTPISPKNIALPESRTETSVSSSSVSESNLDTRKSYRPVHKFSASIPVLGEPSFPAMKQTVSISESSNDGSISDSKSISTKSDLETSKSSKDRGGIYNLNDYKKKIK